MAKQLNVNLNFTADTSQAQRNLTELSKALNNIANMTPFEGMNLSKEMQEASLSAQQLQHHISNAFNVKTGNLDLNKLNASLKSAGTDLNTLSANLLKAGTTGEQAFMNIQRALSTASVQINQANGLLTQFWTTLKNTARWQISSSVLHGFMGALQSAWGYAKDLDKSLNDIRIVTGYGTEQMAEFAEQANRAAKALNTTTTSYTNASLIYYQQGLSNEEVIERTNVTVKMANVAGKSASEVSDQLTAVWNNFYDGSKSLEYYADVMTALGAATASSTDEIAEGLEKFAAVAETVGLSYEYATAALATVTAETRQSADVVGTAFKTLFARLQDLELGETLDDGTTLGKYSAALDAVGINIKDTNGELKDMDQILDELGNKWTNLSKDTQIALAQTVAGTRQYTQLVALMDNWDVFQTNLGTAKNAKGALQEQADIYAESWKAATAKVKASAEGIFNKLFPMKEMAEMAEGFATILEGVGGLVSGLGGLKGILLLISTVVLHAFQSQIGNAIQLGIEKIQKFTFSFKGIKEATRSSVSSITELNGHLKEVASSTKTANEQADYFANNLAEGANQATVEAQSLVKTAMAQEYISKSLITYETNLSKIHNIQALIEKAGKRLTTEQKQQLSLQQQQLIALNEQHQTELEKLEALQRERSLLMNSVGDEGQDADNWEYDDSENLGYVSNVVAAEGAPRSIQNFLTAYNTGLADTELKINNIGSVIQQHGTHIKVNIEDMNKFNAASQGALQGYGDIVALNERLRNIIENTTTSEEEKRKKINEIVESTSKESGILGYIGRQYKKNSRDVTQLSKTMKKAESNASRYASAMGASGKQLKDVKKNSQEIAAQQGKIAQGATHINNSFQDLVNTLSKGVNQVNNFGNSLTRVAQGVSSVAMGISSIKSAVDTFGDAEASWVEKLSAGAMAAVMGLQALMTVMKGVQAVTLALNTAQTVNNALNTSSLVLSGAMTAAQSQEALALVAKKAVVHDLKEEEIQEMIVQSTGMATDKAAALATLMKAGADKTSAEALEDKTNAEVINTVATNAGTVANIAYAVSQWLVCWPLLIIVAVIAAIVAITVALINARKKEIEANKNLAESSRETADAYKEEADAHKELIDSYKEALKTYKETGEGKEELELAALKVAQAYGIEGAALDILREKYDELTKKINAKRKAELEEQKNKQKNAITTTNTAMSDALREGKGRKTNDGRYVGNFGGGWSSSDENLAYRALGEGNYTHLTKSGGSVHFEVSDIADPYEMYAYYMELQDFVNKQQELAAETGASLGESEIYSKASAELEEGAEQFQHLQEYIAELRKTEMEIAAITAQSRTGDGEIDTIAEYLQFEEDYLNQYKDILLSQGVKEGSKEFEKAINEAKAYIASLDSGLAELQTQSKGFDELTNYANKDEIDKLKAYYETLSSEEQSVFWTLDIDENTTKEDVEKAINLAQSMLDSANLHASIDASFELEKLILGDTKNWTEIFKKYAKVKNVSVDSLTYEDKLRLLLMSEKELLAELQGLTTSLALDWSYTIPEAIEDTSQGLLDAQAAQQKDLEAWEQWVVSSGEERLEIAKKAGEISELTYDLYSYALDLNIDLVNKAFEAVTNGTDFYGHQLTTAQSNLLRIIDSVANTDIISVEDLNTLDTILSDGSSLGTYFSMLLGYDPYTEARAKLVNKLYGQTDFDLREKAMYSVLYSMDPQFFEHAEKEFLNYQTLLSNAATSESEITAAQDKILQVYQERTTWFDKMEQMNESLGLDSEMIMNYAEFLENLHETNSSVGDILAENEYVTYRIAQQIALTSKSLQDLSNSIEDITSTLERAAPTTMAYVEAMLQLDNLVSGLLTIDTGMLSNDFLSSEHTLTLLKEAANGSVEALEALRREAARDIVIHAEVKDEALQQQILNMVDSLSNQSFEIGVTLDDTAVMKNFYNLLVKAGMTADQIKAIFDSQGWEAESKVETGYKITEEDLKNGWAKVDLDQSDNKQIVDIPEGAIVGSTLTYTVIQTDSETGGFTYRGSAEDTISTMSELSKETEKVSRKKLDDFIERYYEINNAIDDTTEALEDANRELDKMYGKSRIAQMEKVNNLLEDEIALLERKAKENELWAEYDKTRLTNTLANSTHNTSGLKFKFDENGNITNFTDVISSLYDKLYRMYDIADSKSGDDRTDYEEDVLNPYLEWLESVIDYASTYQNTIEEGEDLANEIAEQWSEWQSNNAEALDLKLELNLSINERELEEIEYYLNKMSDDFYQMAESAALLSSITSDEAGNKIYGGKLGAITSDLNYYSAWKTENDAAFAARNQGNPDVSWITADEYYGNLEEMYSGIYENLNALIELDKTMMHYYGDTLAAAGEELAKFTDRMEDQNAVLDHYASIMTALGKETDYKRMGIILSGQAQLYADQYEVAKKNLEMYAGENGEVQKTYERWQKALAEGNMEAAELYEEEYEAALNAAAEAQDQYLSAAEEWADSLKAILENTLADLNKSLEEALTGGTTFDRLTQSMERAQSLQEEYLTATNKVYETNKLMRTAQQEIDKITNTNAKRRLQAYITETKQLQDQSKLSQFELEIQQAKYDLLLAEIALEEAQNAKSTVRLQRDSEGNFGYVYTADANNIADAQQKLEDARNNLYNIGLEGANNYAQKMIELEKQMCEELAALNEARINGEFESQAEYEQARAELEKYWQEQRIGYSNLYQVAITTDTAIIADAWAADFATMVSNTETWKTLISEYAGDVTAAFEAWEGTIKRIEEETVGKDFKELAEKVSGITTASKELRDFITKDGDGLLATFKKEFDAVKESTGNYALLRKEIGENIAAYENLAKAIKAALDEQDRMNGEYFHYSVGGKDYGHYNDVAAAAKDAWLYNYVKGTMSAEAVKKIAITDQHGNVIGTVGDYYDPSWGERAGTVEIPDDPGSGPDNNPEEPEEPEEPKANKENAMALPRYAFEWQGKKYGPYGSLEKAAKDALVYSDTIALGQIMSPAHVPLDQAIIQFTGHFSGDYKQGKTESNVTPDGIVVNAYIQTYAYKHKGAFGPTNYGSLESAAKNAVDGMDIVGIVTYGKGQDWKTGSWDPRGYASQYGWKSTKPTSVDVNTPHYSKPYPTSSWGGISMDTGGYTGAWGSYGKLAMLHEKELVLNKQQTQDLLLSMEVLERILQAIDLQSINSQIGGILSTPGFSNPGTGTLEQNVHIEASFPNATNHNEIEEAFGNLVNLASQYANRK